MKNLARKYEMLARKNSIDLDTVAVEKDQDYKNECTWWIFKDGSALGIDSHNIVYVKNNYGLHKDHEKL